MARTTHSGAPERRSDGWCYAPFAAVVAFAFCAVLLAARQRGIWFDEIWSMWMSEGGIAPSDLLTERWLNDTHPITFHLANWLLGPLVGEDLFLRRLLNLVPAIYLVAVMYAVQHREPGLLSFAIVLVVAAFSSRTAIAYFPEHRSYFSIVCMTAALAGLLRLTLAVERDFDWRSDRFVAGLLAATILISLNLHYISDVLVGVLLGSAAAALWVLKRPRWAGIVVVTTAAAVALVGWQVAATAPFLLANNQSSWILTTPPQAAGMLLAAVRTAAGNWVLALVALAELIAVGWLVLRLPRPHSGPIAGFLAHPAAGRGLWPFVIVGVLTIAISMGVLFAASLVQPVLVPRYLVSLTAAAAAVASAIAADRIVATRWLALLFCAHAVVLIWSQTSETLPEARWAATADYISDRARSCPDTPIYAIDPAPFIRKWGGTPNTAAIQNWGYALVARQYGFRVQRLDLDRPDPPAGDPRCPTLLWLEHTHLGAAPSELAAMLQAHQPTVHAALPEASLFLGDSGLVLEFPPGALDRATAAATQSQQLTKGSSAP